MRVTLNEVTLYLFLFTKRFCTHQKHPKAPKSIKKHQKHKKHKTQISPQKFKMRLKKGGTK